jgi:hypothetical protein
LMRRTLLAAALAALLCLAPAGCRSRRKVNVQQTEEEAPSLASMVHVADPKVSAQLVNGFYGVEQNAWRWTAGKFSVLLRPPRGAAQKGATLQLKFAVPDPIIAKLKAISLAASIGGKPLSPETYTQPGEFTYSRDVAADLLTGEAVKVDFALDKTLPPANGDQRELGVVVSVVGFEAK